MDKDTSEIAKLTERISKDPKSRLFVPLAEEYKKSGDIEMALHVLTEGLKNNPGYITARSFLGRLLYDRGDLDGAQKEFEEVVKAIPDNLMAQRKLGDTYAHQGRAVDALKHYKAALSLNPKDAELAALASDLEAGRDIKGKIPKPGTPPPPEQPAPKEPQAGGSQQQMKPGPVQAGKPGPAQAGKPMPMELEIPEEVLEVEPLEPEVPKGGGQPHPATEFDFLTEAGQGAAPLLSEEIEKPVAAFGEEEQFPFQPNMEAVSPAEEEQKSGDDFTTDTLAELYIAQGFYEKAIDIYERMLADRPTNQRLSEKLAQVRSMAAGTAPAEAPKAEPGSGALYGDAGPGEFAYQGTDAFAQTAPLDAGFNAMEYVPPAEEAFKPVEYASPVEHRTAEEPFRVPKPKPAAVGRKETIERLESWLKQIAKEK